MQSKGLGGWVQWQFLDIFDVLIDSGGLRLTVYSGFGEFMANFENLRIEVHFDDGGDETNILIVGDSASVVDF